MPPDIAPQPVDLFVTPRRRLHALDGLRGVAAMVVVGYHLLLVVPAVALAFGESEVHFGTVEWWLYRTPLRVFFAGHEAVLVFFVLSGFVLTLPLRPRFRQTGSWLAYYGRRMVRLYLPVWASLVLALILAVLVHRDTRASSIWLAAHKPPTPRALVQDVILLYGSSNLNSPLWSLRWEIWFSLLLPLMLAAIVVIRMHRWWIPGIVLLSASSACAQLPQITDSIPAAFLTVGLLQYLPIFGIGMLLALNLDSLDRLAARLCAVGRPPLVWASVVIVAILFIVSPSFVSQVGQPYGMLSALAYALSVAGVIAVLFAAIEARPFGRFLETRPVQWLGTRSFSIYLVHEPLLVAVALLTRSSGWLPWIFIGLAALPVILVIAELFYRVVERPTIGLSRRVGRRLSIRRHRNERTDNNSGPALVHPTDSSVS